MAMIVQIPGSMGTTDEEQNSEIPSFIPRPVKLIFGSVMNLGNGNPLAPAHKE